MTNMWVHTLPVVAVEIELDGCDEDTMSCPGSGVYSENVCVPLNSGIFVGWTWEIRVQALDELMCHERYQHAAKGSCAKSFSRGNICQKISYLNQYRDSSHRSCQ